MIRFQSACFLVLSLIFAVSVAAQKIPAPAPTVVPEEQNPDDVIRISSELVLVDALVVDSDNNQVRDLSPDEFEIYQDGKRQQITSFSYVDGKQRTLTAAPPKTGKKGLPIPPVSLRRNELGRVITFVIDDGNCLATIEGLATARDGVKKFISEQMLPDDKVAIYRTRGGSSLLQMYTSNKEVLRRSVNRVKWAPSRCGSAFEAARDKSTIKVTGEGASSFESEADRETKEMIGKNENENQVIGTVGVLGFVVDRLKVLPERKLIFLVSEGISTKFGTRAYDALRDLTDKATRSQVVIYTIGTKGVSIPGFISSQDEVLPGIISGNDDTYALQDSRNEEERALNEGMSYLAYSTGGKFLRNQNFLEKAVEKVLEVETGYYLLGYEPDGETFKGKEYHRIEIKLKRPGLRLTSRKGFIGTRESEARTSSRNPANPLYKAIASPFTENAIDVRLTALVKSGTGSGGIVRTLFHLDGSDLTFTDEPGGMKKCVLNVVLVALDEKGKVAEEFNRTYPIRVPARAVETLRQNGLDYSTDISFKKPGFYSLRLAIQDDASKRLGSAGNYVEIPNVSKAGFFINALVTTAVAGGNRPLVPKSRPINAGFAPVFQTDLPSIREYKAGEPLAYVYDIYNAKADKTNGRPSLTSRILLYKDGVLQREIPETPIELDPASGGSMIEDYGFLKLGGGIDVGEYILQLIVTDNVAKKSDSQWIDFEVIP
jgi:VWFA-related protein